VSAARAEMNLAQKVARLSRLVKQARPERKFMDISVAMNNVPLTGTGFELTAIPQGLTNNTRIGDRVRCLSIYGAGYASTLVGSFVGGTDDYFWRVFVVIDKEGLAVASNVPVFPDQVSSPVQMLKNDSFLDKFKVVFDSGPMVLSSPQGALAQKQTQGFYRFNKKLNLQTNYTGPNAANLGSNTVQMLIYTNVPGILDVFGSTRITFIDS
jgi:hypothetical protein